MKKNTPEEYDFRPPEKTWEEDFAERQWNSKEVDEMLSKEAVRVLWNCLKGRKVNEYQQKAAEFIANNKAWPKSKESTTININVLRLEDLERAKIKAGLMAPKVMITSEED
jgi:hypothetical protein